MHGRNCFFFFRCDTTELLLECAAKEGEKYGWFGPPVIDALRTPYYVLSRENIKILM